MPFPVQLLPGYKAPRVKVYEWLSPSGTASVLCLALFEVTQTAGAGGRRGRLYGFSK